MGDQALVDAVTELCNQIQLIRQQNLEVEAVQVARAAQEQVNREKKGWINDKAVKLEKCEGLPADMALGHDSSDGTHSPSKATERSATGCC